MSDGTARWSASLVAEGDRVVSHAEIVELADAVAASGGIASGIGTTSYGAQLVVWADDVEDAAERARAVFAEAAATAGLPPWPITRFDIVGEDEELEDE